MLYTAFTYVFLLLATILAQLRIEMSGLIFSLILTFLILLNILLMRNNREFQKSRVRWAYVFPRRFTQSNKNLSGSPIDFFRKMNLLAFPLGVVLINTECANPTICATFIFCI